MLLAGACKKHNEEPTPAVTTGFSWTADNINYTSTSAAVTDDGFMMTLAGTYTATGGSNVIRLSVPLATGTYNTAATTYSAYYYMAYLIYTGSTSSAYVASNAAGTAAGTVTVTTLSATDVAGTFSFTGEVISGTATKTVTNGRFALKR